MSESDTNAIAFGHGSRRFLTKRFVRTQVVYFVSVVVICSLLMLSFSASMCYWNPHVACFSFSRHGGSLVAEILRSWFPLALVAACLAAIADHIPCTKKWWRDTAIIFAAVVATGLVAEAWVPARAALLRLPRATVHDPLFFVIEFTMLQLAFALCRIVAPCSCKAEPWQQHHAA